MSGARPSERAETGPLRADPGDHPAEPVRPLLVQARESCPFTRKCRRITAQAKNRPSLHGGPGGDEQDKAAQCGVFCGSERAATGRGCVKTPERL